MIRLENQEILRKHTTIKKAAKKYPSGFFQMLNVILSYRFAPIIYKTDNYIDTILLAQNLTISIQVIKNELHNN